MQKTESAMNFLMHFTLNLYFFLDLDLELTVSDIHALSDKSLGRRTINQGKAINIGLDRSRL